MARLADLLGNAQKQDMIRVSKKESLPYRGRKKHISQMTKEEQSLLWDKLKGVRHWKVSDHALGRITAKGIEVTYKDVVSTIHNSTIREYHMAQYKGKPDARVLLRGNAVVNDHYNVHFVYSLTRREVVSAWINDLNDRHKTLDMKDYDRRMKIRGI